MAEDLIFEDELLRVVYARPFSPFVLVTGSGERYEVDDPSAIIIGRDVVVVVSPRTGVAYLRIYHVVGFEVDKAQGEQHVQQDQ